MKKLYSEEEMDKWLTGFLDKLNRTSSRKAECRLILSVERMLFDDHKYAVHWQYVRFGENEAEILDKKRKPLGEKIKITEFQRMILESNEMKSSNPELCRSELEVETGEWIIPDELKDPELVDMECYPNGVFEGGEALVFTQKFEKITTAVRVHIFDPFLFTKEFGRGMVIPKAHYEKGKFFSLFLIFLITFMTKVNLGFIMLHDSCINI